MRPLSRSAFRRRLHDGRGTAYLHVLEHGEAGVEDILEDAVRHCRVWDVQLEPPRAPWLREVIRVTREPARYEAAAVEAVGAARRWRDIGQAADLAVVLAREGRDEARQALYARLARADAPAPDLLVEPLIALDGFEGLLRIARATHLHELRWRFGDPVQLLAGDDEAEAASIRAELARIATADPAVASFLAAMQAHRPPWIPNPVLTLDEVADRADTAPAVPAIEFNLYPPARHASDADVLAFYDRMLSRTEPDVLVWYLRLFRHRPLPRLDPLLFVWARADHAALQQAALEALARVTDPRIHDLGVTLLRTHGPSVAARGALELFERNYRQGDHRLLAASLPEHACRYDRWWVSHSLLAITAHHIDDFGACLTWVLVHSPDASQREFSLRDLLEERAAPHAMLAEALYDTNEETRQLAANALGVEPPW